MSQASIAIVAAPHITLAGTDTRVTVVSADTPVAVLTMAEPPLTLVALSPDPVTVVGAGYGLQGPPGQGGNGAGTAAAGTFILDVTGAGVVADKAYAAGALQACSSDTAAVRVWVGCEGDATAYTPSVAVNAQAATLTESATKRWFTGYADITLDLVGANTVTALSSTGSTAVATITRLAGGPQVTGIALGPYPGVQTELKAGDTIGVTVQTETTATQVSISGAGAVASTTLPAVNGVATGTLTAGAGNGALTFTATARNAFGTYGDAFTSPALALNQTHPSFSAFTVVYPSGQQALGAGETADVSCTVSNADTVTYTATGLTVPAGYAATKPVTNVSTGYVASGTNYTASAVRTANNASAQASTLVKIATVAPSAAITAPTRLTSSPAGTDHQIRIYPSQTLLSAPSLDASVGAWQSAWVNAGSYWSRNLRIADADAKGSATFSALALAGLSGLFGGTITAGAGYTVGGMSARTLTFPAFSRVAALGCAVGDPGKTSASVVGGNTLVRFLDASVLVNGYYIANADGSYNANGAYLGLSDAALAGANTSGTLQVSFTEVA